MLVTYSTNWTTRAPGQCAGLDHCGHILVNIDGSNCNAAGSVYNSIATSPPAQADLSKCNMATGSHVIQLELTDDNNVAVKDLLGNAQIQSITVTVQ